MADIVVIYGKEDKQVAGKLAALLETRWNVWWDKYIKERFAEEIQKEISEARCVVVLWSKTSRLKDTVRDDVQLAKDHGVSIVGVSLDGCRPGYGYIGYSSSQFSEWDGTNEHPAYKDLFSRLISVLPIPQPPGQPKALANGRVPLPTLFLSVSSFETQLAPDQAVKALRICKVPAILVSAWDLVKRKKTDPISRDPAALIEELRMYRDEGGFVLLDSGNYESSRLSMHDWAAADLEQALSHGLHDWAFCFDKLSNFNFEKNRAPTAIAKRVTELVQYDMCFTDAPILPVVHAPPSDDSGYHFELLPTITRLVAEELQPDLIGIPERELGAGLVERTETMRAIRKELDALSFYQPVHLLGTGNPWTVSIMAAAGADTFDGLEWCRTVVDRENDRLNHFQHFDLFSWQAELSASVIVRESLKEGSGVDFAGKVGFHNIDYFLEFGTKLRDAASKGRLEGFVTARLGKAAVEKLHDAAPGIFDDEV